MGPLQSIILICVDFTIRFKWVYLDHFIPKLVNSGERVQTELQEMKQELHVLFYLKYNIYRWKIIIPFSEKTPNRYYWNILRVITLVYHMYIEYKSYKFVYNKNTGFSMKVNLYIKQWVIAMTIIYLWKLGRQGNWFYDKL